MSYSTYTTDRIEIGDNIGEIHYCDASNSYVVAVRISGGNWKDLVPAYGNGVAAQNRLKSESRSWK